MTVLTIELPDEQKAALAAKAQAKGLSAEQYARLVLEHDLAPEWLRRSWETSKDVGLDQLSMEEIDAEIDSARKAPPNEGSVEWLLACPQKDFVPVDSESTPTF
jgi:plasmid stability protein